MKSLKKNQIVVFAIALMLVSVGYFGYIVNDGKKFASIGDARLVNANTINDEYNTNCESEPVFEDEVETKDNCINTINTNSEEVNTKPVDDYYSSSRLTRSTMYSQMLEAYEKILSNDSIPTDQKTIAQNEVKNINDLRNRIMICENLIKTKGFEDLIIFVNDDNIDVIIKANKLEQEQIAQIQNIITREFEADLANVHISTKI